MRSIALLCAMISLHALGQGRFGLTILKDLPDFMADVSPDGTYFISGYANTFYIHNRVGPNYVKGQHLVCSNDPDPSIDEYGISVDGNLIAASSDDNNVYVFRRIAPGKFKKIATLTDFDDEPERLSFSADGAYLIASEGRVNDVRSYVLYKIDGDAVTKVRHEESYDYMSFDPLYPDLIWKGEKLFEFHDGKMSYPLHLLGDDKKSYRGHIYFSSDGNYCASIASAKNDLQKILIWKRTEKANFYLSATQLTTKRTKLDWLTFTPDNRYLVAYDNYPEEGKKRLIVYKIDGDSLIHDSDVPLLKYRYGKLLFSSDGLYAFGCAGWDELLYKVNGVKGNSFFKTKPVITTTSTAKTSPTVKTDTIIKTVPPPQVNITNVVWITPNPDVMNDKPVISEKDMIEIQVKVISNKVITKDDIKVIINGKEMPKNKFNEVSLKEGPKSELNEFTYINNVPLEETPDNINTIEVFANGKNTKTLKVLYSPAKPNLHILSIGAAPDRDFSMKDAQDFAGLFAEQGKSKNSIYGNVSIKMLLGKEATTTAIKESIEKLRYDFKVGAIGPKDVVLIFLSSQGFMMDGQLRIQGNDYKDMYRETYSFSYHEIASRLKDVGCKKLIFLDAAHNSGSKSSISEINSAIALMNAQAAGLTTFNASSNDEFSYEDKSWQNGAFMYCIREGLSWKGDKDQNGIVTISELYDYVSAKVPVLVKAEKKKEQHPTMPVSELLKSISLYVTNKQ